MLRSMPAQMFREWQTYEELEPFAEERADENAAHIVQFLWALSGDTKYPNGRPLSDFVLKFGDAPRPEKVVQTVETQELLLMNWIGGHNAVVALKEGKKN